MKKGYSDIRWQHLVRLCSVPPALRFVQRYLHRKWLLKPPCIGHNMNKFSYHLWCDCYPVTSREQLSEQAQSEEVVFGGGVVRHRCQKLSLVFQAIQRYR